MTDQNPFDAVVGDGQTPSDNPFDAVVGGSDAAPSVVNPFEDAIRLGNERRSRQQFLEVMRNSQGVDPARQAKAIDVAKTRGVPVGVAYEYLDELEQKPGPNYDDLAKQAPETARLLSDPIKGPVTFTDYEPLSAMEQGLRDLGTPRAANLLETPDGPLSLYEQMFGAGAADLTPEQARSEQQRIIKERAEWAQSAELDKQRIDEDRRWREQNDPMFARDFGGEKYNPNTDLRKNEADRQIGAANAKLLTAVTTAPKHTDAATWFNSFGAALGSGLNVPGFIGSMADWSKTIVSPGDPTNGQGNFLTEWGDTWTRAIDELFPQDRVKAQNTGPQFAAAVGTFMPIIATAWFTQGASASLGFSKTTASALSATSAALAGSAAQVDQAKREMRDFTLTPYQKAIYGLGNAAIGLLDAIPAERLLGLAERTGGRWFARILAGAMQQAMVEAPTEAIQQGLQDTLAKYLFDPQRDVVGNMITAFKIGGLAGGFFGGAAIVVNSAAERNYDKLIALGEAAKKARISEIAPKILDEHIKHLKRSGKAPEQVTAPVEAVETLFQELTPEMAQQFPETAKSLEEARGLRGGDPKAATVEVTIPTEELIRLGKLKGYSAFAADVSVDGELSLNEKVKLRDELQKQLLEADTSNTPQAESPIFKDIRDQLIAAGNSQEVATAQARLLDAFFTTTAERSPAGITAADLARRHGLQITNTAITAQQLGPQLDALRKEGAGESAAPKMEQVSKPASDGKVSTVRAYTVDNPLGFDEPVTVKLVTRSDGTGYIRTPDDQIIDVSAMLDAGFPPEKIIAIAMGDHREGSEPDTSKVKQVPVEGQAAASPKQDPALAALREQLAAAGIKPADLKGMTNEQVAQALAERTLNQSTNEPPPETPAVKSFLEKLSDRVKALVNPIYTDQVPPKKLKGNEEAARWLEQHYTGTPITDFTAEIPDNVLREIGNVMAAEAIYALKRSGNAYDWYSAAMQRALQITAIKWPILGNDAAAAEAGFGTASNARFVFTYIMAVTSQNLDVAANAVATNKAFDEMVARVKAGNFTMSKAWGTGDKQAAMGENFAKFGPLIEAMDGGSFPEKLSMLDNLFRQKMKVSDWVREMKAAGVPFNPPGQTAMDAVVYGSALLGPKIGNGFWQNLNGNFLPLTIDLWMRRTWGRLTGKSIGNEAALPAQRARLKASVLRSINSPELDMDALLPVLREQRAILAELRALDDRIDLNKKQKGADSRRLKARLAELKDIAADLRGIPVPEAWKKAYDTDNAQLAAYAKRLLGVWNKEYKRLREQYPGGVPAKMQPTWARGAKRLKADLTTPLDQVANGTQRKQIEASVRYAQQTLADLGYDVTTADLQAILWYPEKELWNALTTALDVDSDGDPVIPPSPLNESYDTVFTRILNAEGYDTQQGAAGDAAGGSDGGPVAAAVGARPVGAQDQGVSVADGTAAAGTGAPQSQVTEGPSPGPSSSQTTLNQGGPEARGYIQFGPLRDKFRITLTEKANLSTFIHEGGHFFLEVLQDLVARGEASAQQVADLRTLKRWMAIEDGKQIDRNGHEKFARSWEQFIMEGKAPSLALHGIFQKFKAWMIFVYKRLANVRGDLNDEIREVMDRLVASDAAIAEARALVGWRGQPMSQEETGLTDAEYKAYVGEWTKANDAQSQDADARIMLEAARALKQTWTDEKNKVTKEVEKELEQTRGWKAWKLLETGEGLQDVRPGWSDLKIDPESIPREWRRDTKGMTAAPHEGGLPLDMVAEILDFTSGEQMLQAIGGAKLARKAIPIRVRQIMVERHGEMDAASLAQEAMKAVHNTPTMDVLLTEFRALAAKANLKVGKDTKRMVRLAAEERVAQLTQRQLDPGKWRRAEVKAAEEAGKLAAKGRDMEAALAKRRQLMAAAMAKASLDAQDRIAVMKDYLATFTTNRRRAALGRAGESYLDAVDQILEGVQFKEVSLKNITARKSLNEFIKEQEAAGEPVFISDKTRDMLGRRNYSEMTLEELEGVHDAVKNLWTVAKEATTIRKGQEKMALEQALADITAETEKTLPEKKLRDHLNPGRIDKMMAGLSRYHAGNLKIEFIVDWMGKTAHSLIYQPISDAAYKSWTTHRDLTAPFLDKLRTMPKEQRRRWTTKRSFMNLPMEVTGANMWMAALNLGNEGNKAKLLQGYGWSEAQLMAELNQFMTKADWDLAQETWDTIDKMWPEIERVVKKATGLAPPRVEPTPIETPFGTYRGGYFPVVYDTYLDERMSNKLDSSISPEEMFAKRFTAFVINNGFTKGRTANTGKLLLSPTVIADHLGEVIHYVTHYDAVKQADKIMRSPEFKRLVKTRLGDSVYSEMKKWLVDVATNTTDTDRNTRAGDRTLRWLRQSAQLTSLGFNMLSALKQPLGVVNALDAIGPVHWAHGVQKAWLSPNVRANWRFAFEHSKELGPLMKNYDRDAAQIAQEFAKNTGSRIKDGAYLAAFMPMNVMQSIANVATWHGAYLQATKQGMSEAEAYNFADKTVRMTQGGAAIKDMAGIQRGGEANKFFTMFYSYFSVVFNRMADIQTREKGAKNLHRKAMRYTVLLLIPAILNMAADDAWEDMFHEDRAEKRDQTPYLVRIALETFSGAAAAFPVAREFYGLGEAVLLGNRPRSVPAIGVFDQLFRAGSAAKGIALDDDDLTRSKARALVAATGIVTGTPIYGIYRAIDDVFGQKMFDE